MEEMKKLIDLYSSIFYVEDPSMIPLLIAVTLSARMPGDPIWLMLVGGSSSGKTELLNALGGVDYVREVDLLTPNTLLSGMKAKAGKETSLLLKMKRKSVMVMKDFTTILSMNKEDQQAIMGQFRQIFDGEIVKDTGTGDALEWKGKMCLVAGVTEKIHIVEERFTSMGTRFINYTMPLQDRIKTTKRSAEIAHNIKEHRETIRTAFTDYMNGILPKIEDQFEPVSDEVSENFVNLANMASLARSPIERNWKEEMGLVLSPEMPMRMSNQLHMLGGIFMTMFDGNLPSICEQSIYKIAIDSIPKGRRLALKSLAQFDESTTKRIAIDIHYTFEQTRRWLEELDVLGLIERTDRGSKDFWHIKPEFANLMQKFGKIEKVTSADPFANESDEVVETEISEERNDEEIWRQL